VRKNGQAEIQEMQTGDLPDDVLRFLADRIDTVPHLEALLLLWESRPRGWTVEEIAARVYVPAETAARILADLARQGLAVQGAEVYAYEGGWDTSGENMEKVATAYRRQLVRVASLIHSKASRGVLEFARAFELKKKG
jgi:hypothetical protein